MRKLLLLLLLLPGVCVANWRESFESSAFVIDYPCWDFGGGEIRTYSDGFDGWRHLVMLNADGTPLKTPVLVINEGANDWLNFLWYTHNNVGKEAVMAVDFVTPEGVVVQHHEERLPGNGSAWRTVYPPPTYRGKLQVYFYVQQAEPGVRVYVDELWGQQLTVEKCEQVTFPVTLMHFTARDGWLEWATATEYATERFSVEHATDGLTFREVGSVPAAGNSQVRQDYTWPYAKTGGTNYFRLRIIDSDGTWEYSKVVAVVGAEEVSFGPFTIGAGEVVEELRVLNASGQHQRRYTRPGEWPELPRGEILVVQLRTDTRIRTKKIIYN